jgi:uncharacterized protein GlcG (DUF336 family)
MPGDRHGNPNPAKDRIMDKGISLPVKAAITLAAAKAILDAAERFASAAGLRVSIAIVDDGGHLLHFVRMDGVHVGTVEISIAKARTAVAFRRPTKVFAEQLAGGASGLLALPGLIPYEGGVPLTVSGSLIGAIGVSGGRPEQDGEVAAAAADYLASLGTA